jgi:hypothetical protein
MRICLFTRVRGALLLLLSIARFGSPPEEKRKADSVEENPLSEQSVLRRQQLLAHG